MRRDVDPDGMPPGPDGLPVLGTHPSFLRDPYGFMTRMAREYGDVVAWEDPGGPVYQLNHPEYIEQVLVGNNENYLKGENFQTILRPMTGNGILNSEGAIWRRNRHLIQPAFGPDRIEEYASMMTDVTTETLEDWTDGETRPFHEDMMTVTLRIVARALFGVEIDDHVDTIGSALEEFMRATERLSHLVLPPGVPTLSRVRIRRARTRIDDVVDGLIASRSDGSDDDVISTLLEATTDDGRGLTREEVRDEVVTLLLAGHETTALALSFAAYLLAQHPHVETRLVAELEDVLDGDPPTMADVPELSYTERVLKETMRLYPPVPGVVREPAKPDVVGGYEIPAGATIRMHQWVVHRDSRWYDDPLAFQPERWTDELERELPKLAYFPFSAGPRRCIGDRFAMLEATLVLATIYDQYHLELVPGTDLDLRAVITARPKDEIRMTVHRRDGW
ncbi:cytochrome P450 [Natrialbaceae archaeon AArc-T1-2]|uniref:cytochrome P450 n=1 Tax=Natrialbaceae archaeon AArc-T1-2 TaxID=3053904 RepID=UPI00255B0BD9|nr:cytochrome P450 [Natrialbaceae archaeon AArc-T1-2]WIV66229.1 cytochrome P450 [Natrialbaceae archaeon AArc-T1-2]